MKGRKPQAGGPRYWIPGKNGGANHNGPSFGGSRYDYRSREVGHQVGVGFVQLEHRREGFDGAAQSGGGDRAGEFEGGGENEVGVCVEVDGGPGSGGEDGAIWFADGAADHHLGGVENADDGLALIELVTFLGVAHGVVAIQVLVGDHSGEVGAHFELGDVVLGAVERDLLAVALEFENVESGDIALVVGGLGALEAFEVEAGGGGFELGF